MKKYICGFLIAVLICMVGTATTHAQKPPLTPMSLQDFQQRIIKEQPIDNVSVKCQQNETIDFDQFFGNAGDDSIFSVITIPVAIQITNSNIDCDVWSSQITRKIVFNRSVNFTNTVFTGNVNLPYTVFMSTVNFNQTTFNKTLNLEISEFKNSVTFSQAKFPGACRAETTSQAQSSNKEIGSSFTSTIFRMRADFSGVNFGQNTQNLFANSEFHKGVSLVGAHFCDEVVFMGTQFGDPDPNTVFGPEVEFTGAIFDKAARFQQVKAQIPTSFRSATFNNKLSFRNSVFTALDLTGITMKGDEQLDLFKMTYSSLVAYDFDFNWVTTSVDDSTTGVGFTKGDALGVFLKLEANFREQGRQTLANEAFYNERHTECTLPQSSRPDCLLSSFSGYLVHVDVLLKWSVICVLLSAILLCLVGGKQKNGEVNSQPEQTSNGPWNRILQNLPNAIALSFVAFVSIAAVKSDSVFKNVAVKTFISLLVHIEWVIGIFALLALGATLANTSPLLAQLLSKVGVLH